MILRSLTILITSLFVLFPHLNFAQGQCLPGGCAFGGIPFPSSTFTSTNTYATVSASIYAGEYQLYNVVAGTTYDWSYCATDGGSTTADLQLTLFNNATQAVLCYSDDFCGNAPKITWTATFTGVVRVLTSQWNCQTNTSNQRLVWRGVAPVSSVGECLSGGCAFGGIQYPLDTFIVGAANFNLVAPDIYVGAYQIYSVVAGAEYDWSYCMVDGGSTTLDLELTLFNELTEDTLCYSNDFCGNAPRITWTATFTGLVRLLTTQHNCQGDTTGGTGGGSAAQRLVWRGRGSGGPNGSCSSAIALSCNQEINGTTFGASVDLSPLCGSATAPTAPGVWYTIVGTGSPLTVNTCTGTNFDTQISVFEGTCSNLTCIAGNDDDCFTGSSVTWPSVAGTTYYILVHGYGTNSGIFRLTVVSPLSASIASNSSLCAGASTDLTVTGGSVFAWSTGESTANITVNPSSPTTYQVTVSNALGCEATASITVNIVGAVSIQGPDSICQGSMATLTALGSGTYTYQWSTGQTDLSISVNPNASTTYSLTATDGNGCTATASMTLEVRQVIASINALDTVCRGSHVTATASGGNSYVWASSNSSFNFSGQTWPSVSIFDLRSPITFYVTVSNGFCTDTASTTIELYPDPWISLTITAPSRICVGETATLYGSGTSFLGGALVGSFSWQWDNGSASWTDSITVQPSSSGQYQLIHLDYYGCEDTTSWYLVVDPLPSLSITPASTNICQGDNVSFTVSGAGNYNWNVGVSGATLSAQPSITTTYTVTGTDANGCSATASATANVSGGSSVTISEAGCNSELTVNLNGGTYLWSTGASTQSIIPTGDAVYSVTATDANGCSGTASLPFTQVGSFSLSVDSITNTSSNSGAIQIAVSGGRAPYSFNWSNGSNDQNLSNLAPGTYAVTATDARGCSQTGSYTVQLLSAIETSEALANWTVFPNPTRHTVQVRSSLVDEVLEYSLFDAQGRLLQAAKLPAQTGGQWQIQLQDYPEGMYFLRLQQGEQVRTERLMILQP